MTIDLCRREVLAGLAVLGVGAATPRGAILAQAAAPKHVRIDVHHHFQPPAFDADISKALLLKPGLKGWTVEKSLEDMEKGGVTTAMLSNTTPALWVGDPILAKKLARTCNDYAAKLCADHPGRFGLFAAMPLPDIDTTLAEIAYALDTLKADGIGLFTSYGDKWLGDPAFDPVFAELNRRKAVVYTHPTTATCCTNLIADVNDSEIEFGTDTTRAIAKMVFSGSSQRYPDIRMIFSHAGGTMPFLIRRFTKDAKGNPKLQKLLPNGFLPEAHRFYYDIAQAPVRAPMLALKEVIPVSQIVFGTDYPYLTAAEHVQELKESRVFTDAELRAIDGENALRFLPRFKS